MNLLKHVNITKGSTVIAESTTMNSRIVDMAGYEGAAFILVGSTLFSGLSITMNVQGSTANSTTAMKSFTQTINSTAGATLTSTAVGAAGANYRIMAIDCYKPTKRYIRAQVNGSSSGRAEWLVLQYGARRPGSSALNNSTTLAASTAFASPTT